MNRWHVYEWLKQTYMFSGRIPTAHQIAEKFKDMSISEIKEGILEFMSTVHGQVEKKRSDKGLKRNVRKGESA